MSLFNLRYVSKVQKPQRIEALSDCTFAIVMTILVLELALGETENLEALQAAFTEMNEQSGLKSELKIVEDMCSE